MDNILLDSLPEGESILSAHYVLDHILVTGHASEDERGTAPAGLQLNLEPMGRPGQAVSDTTVMSNLGYFQLKARPGTWLLQPTAGRSRDLYEIKGGVGSRGQEVMVTSFEPEPIVFNVAKRAGKEMESLSDLGGAAASSSIWGSFSGMFGSSVHSPEGSVAPAGGANNGTIHVFSLASGHLYERFLKIMMLSVVRNTKSPVKFWLLRNFLSPAFKETIGAFASKHGFEYELVTYKWPSWLHGQTEKQRWYMLPVPVVQSLATALCAMLAIGAKFTLHHHVTRAAAEPILLPRIGRHLHHFSLTTLRRDFSRAGSSGGIRSSCSTFCSPCRSTRSSTSTRTRSVPRANIAHQTLELIVDWGFNGHITDQSAPIHCLCAASAMQILFHLSVRMSMDLGIYGWMYAEMVGTLRSLILCAASFGLALGGTCMLQFSACAV